MKYRSPYFGYLSCILPAIVLAATSAGLHAQALLRYDYHYSLSPTEIDMTGGLSFFDSSLGTLTGATLILNQEVLTTISLSNARGAGTETAEATSTSLFRWSSTHSAVDSIIRGPDGVGSGKQILVSTGLVDIPVGQTHVAGPLSSLSNVEIDLASYLSIFQQAGGGSFDLRARTLSGMTLLGGGGNIDSTQRTEATVGAAIIYTYTPVPEPSAAVLGAAACGLFLVRRRR